MNNAGQDHAWWERPASFLLCGFHGNKGCVWAPDCGNEEQRLPLPISHLLSPPAHFLKGQGGKGCSYLLRWRYPREPGRPAGRAQGLHASGPTGSPAGYSSHLLVLCGMDLTIRVGRRGERTFENSQSHFALLVSSLPDACGCSRGSLPPTPTHTFCTSVMQVEW